MTHLVRSIKNAVIELLNGIFTFPSRLDESLVTRPARKQPRQNTPRKGGYLRK